MSGASAEMAARMTRLAQALVEASDGMVGDPGSGPTQIGLMNAAGRFAIAAAIHDLASAVRESKRPVRRKNEGP